MLPSNEIRAGTTSRSTLPEWHKIYFAALLEVDEWKALIEMGRAGKAMEDRLQQLRSSDGENAAEIQDLDSALTYLRLLLLNMDAENGRLPWH